MPEKKAEKAKAEEQEAAEQQPAQQETAEPRLPGTAGVVDPNATADAVASTLPASVAAPQTDDGDAPEPPRKARRGHQLLRYVGHADVVSHGDIRFRPGEVVEVHKDVAEELLTLPYEEFEVVTVEAEGDDG